MKKRLICWLVLLLMVMAPVGALAESVGVLRYEKTESIKANLTISGNTAKCVGMLYPLKGKNCSLTLTLYQMKNSKWVAIESWSIGTTGGKKAELEKTKTVSFGTYKLKAVGTVEDETSTYETGRVTCG